MHLHPSRAVKNFFSGLIYRKNVLVHPQPQQESIFRTVFAVWLRFGGRFRQSLRATTKKRSSTFLAKKVHPRRNPGYAYGTRCSIITGPLAFSGIT